MYLSLCKLGYGGDLLTLVMRQYPKSQGIFPEYQTLWAARLSWELYRMNHAVRLIMKNHVK